MRLNLSTHPCYNIIQVHHQISGNCWSGTSFNQTTLRCILETPLGSPPENVAPRLGEAVNLIGNSVADQQVEFVPYQIWSHSWPQKLANVWGQLCRPVSQPPGGLGETFQYLLPPLGGCDLWSGKTDNPARSWNQGYEAIFDGPILLQFL